jgi:predicted ATPase
MIESIKLSNFLSFGKETNEIKMERLNIIIGTNGSGKSNFLEAFDLLRCAPSDITRPIREGGGVSDWLFKGSKNSEGAKLEVIVNNTLKNAKYDKLRYLIGFNAFNQQFEIVDEKILSRQPDIGQVKPYIFYDYDDGKPTLNILTETNSTYKERKLQREDIDTSQSILVQKRDDLHYPEITFLAQTFSRIKMYREWSFGRYTPARLPQKVDLPNNYLEADCGNLGLVLNQIRNNLDAKKHLLQELKYFYYDVEDYEINIAGSTVQIFFQERGLKTSVPATRLSDGTLRYLCLLAILCHPTPPPLICIEEPELGLHPDVLPNLAKLLSDTSARTQLIVTTHSDILVDAFTDQPEVIMVAEKHEGSTELTRLDSEKLKPWLNKYRLGQLWTRGDIGGTRW